MAVRGCRLDLVKLLIGAGANACVINADGKLPYELSFSCNPSVAIGQVFRTVSATSCKGAPAPGDIREEIEPIDLEEQKSASDTQLRLVTEAQRRAVEFVRKDLPKQIDNEATLVRVESEGAELIYSQQIRVPKEELPSHWIQARRARLIPKVCGQADMRKILQFGGVYSYYHYDAAGVGLGQVRISLADCDRKTYEAPAAGTDWTLTCGETVYDQRGENPTERSVKIRQSESDSSRTSIIWDSTAAKNADDQRAFNLRVVSSDRWTLKAVGETTWHMPRSDDITNCLQVEVASRPELKQRDGTANHFSVLSCQSGARKTTHAVPIELTIEIDWTTMDLLVNRHQSPVRWRDSTRNYGACRRG